MQFELLNISYYGRFIVYRTRICYNKYISNNEFEMCYSAFIFFIYISNTIYKIKLI